MLHFVYELVDPRTNTPGYVGITNNPNQRYFEHIELRVKKGKKNDWIKQMLADGVTPKMRILEVVETREEARAREKFWIQQYIEQGMELTNAHHISTKNEHKARVFKSRRVKSDTGMDPNILLPEQACKQLGTTKGQLMYWAKREYIDSVKLPNGRICFRRSDVDELEEKLWNFLNK